MSPEQDLMIIDRMLGRLSKQLSKGHGASFDEVESNIVRVALERHRTQVSLDAMTARQLRLGIRD